MQVWIGVKMNEIQWEWQWASNGQAVDQIHWAPGEPDVANRPNNCLSLMSRFGFKWGDAPCSVITYGNICEKDLF